MALAQALQELLGAVRMGVKPAHDLALEDVELAGTRRGRASPELFDIGPLGHRADVEVQRTRGLSRSELLAGPGEWSRMRQKVS